MEEVKKTKLDIDKVEFEQMVDRYLEAEVPLSYLMEDYSISYPQMKLLINRAVSYTKKTDNLYDTHPNSKYGEQSQSYIAIPHEMQEEYPTDHEERMALFAKIEELKANMSPVTRDYIRIIDEKIAVLEEQLKKVNPNDILRAEKVVDILENTDKAELAADFERVLYQNHISPQELKSLDEIYSLLQQLNNLKTKKVEAEQELREANRIRRQIENIRSDLTVQNIKLVNFCIRYFFSGIPAPQDEMQLYGLEGLARAINGFDYTKGFHFSTYAVPTIVHTIETRFKEMMGIEWKDYCMKESIRYYRSLYQEWGDFPAYAITPQLLAASGLVSYTEKQIASSDELIDPVVPFADVETPFDEEYDYGLREFPATFDEYESVDNHEDAGQLSTDDLEREFFEKYNYEMIMDVLLTLTHRESEVLMLRFGLDGRGTKTLRQVARMFNVTPERIRQIEAKALRKLRHPRRAKKLMDLVDCYETRGSLPEDQVAFQEPARKL